jgi:translation initiation factor 2 alpha subunit (eIF-2alpha)
MLSAKQEAAPMDDIKAFNPPDVGDDEHIIRRLGWALVRQWASLPDNLKAQIAQQAVFLYDKHATVQLNEQINAVIRKHAGGQ